MAGQYRFKDQNGNIVAQISASVEGAIAFSGSVVDFTQANNVILGNVQLAGTASNALLLDGFDSQAFAFTSSIHPFTASIAGTNIFTSSATARLNSIETISASNVSRLNAVETITASNIARLNSIETITSSNLARLNALEIKTGSLATTGSNTFIGTQTITGSLYISSDLIVQGSSSLQNITASAVSIGTNIINLNTANPAIRYAGLSIGDSGSIGSSGSFLYDSVQDEMIFIHRGANTTVTSSVVLMGPQTFDNIGGETYPTLNIVQKGTGNEHLVDSCIFDNGTTTCVKNNFVSTGTICSAGTICGLTINSNGVVTGNDFYNGLTYPYNTNFGSGADASTATIRAGSTSGYQSCITLQGGNVGGCILVNTSSNQRLNITSTGIACFSCQVCTPSSIIRGTINEQLILDFIVGAGSYTHQSFRLCGTNQYRIIGDTNGTFVLRNDIVSSNVLTFACTGIATFACQIQTNGGCININRTDGTPAVLQLGNTSNGYQIQYTCTGGQRLAFMNGAPSEYASFYGTGIACFLGTVCAPKFIATHLAATCLTLNGFSSGNGFKMDYGNASGQITAINLMANGTTNGFIGIQMVDGSNGDLWFGSSNNRSMTIYRTGNHGFNVNAPCTKVHVEGSHGTTWGGNYCYYGGGVSGGGFPFGDEYGNGAAYTYQTANTSQPNLSLGLGGGFAAGYFKGGGGGSYGGGGAGIVAIGGNGANSESVNSGGGAGIFARGGKNGAGSLHSYAGWFDGGDVMVRCGFLGVNNTAPRTFVHIVGASCGADVACGFGNADARGTLHVEACSGFQNSNITVENAYGIGQFMQWSTGGMRIGHRILKGGGTGDVHMTAGQDSVKLLIYATGNIGAPSGSNIYNASDCRLKKNIRTISYGLCDVMKLQPKIFNWKDNFTPSENGKEMLGFIAQDVQPIVPEVVEQFSDGSDVTFDCETISNPLRVNEKFIIPILTKAIQEQQCMIDTLKSCLGIS